MKDTKKKINIGIICSPRLGGSGVVGSELARYLAQTGKYKIVFIGTELPFRLSKDAVRFYKVERLDHALFASPLTEAGLTEGIVEAVIKYDIDILHAHFALPYAYCAIQAKNILKKMGIHVSVITTLHGTDTMTLGNEAPAIMRYIIAESDAVTAVSIDLAQNTQIMYSVKKAISVIYNFVDFETLPKTRKNNLLRNKFAKPDEKIFVHLSNFRPVKRVTDTLKVFLKVRSIMPSTMLLIGEGPDMDAAKKLAKSVKNQDSIVFIGKVKNPYKYLQIADGLILTSLYESFSLAALEAMAGGVPVFATRVGGVPEVVTDGESGYLAEPEDVNTLANAILAHFSSSEKVSNMKEKSKEHSQRFDARNIVPQYEYLYRKLYLYQSIKITRARRGQA